MHLPKDEVIYSRVTGSTRGEFNKQMEENGYKNSSDFIEYLLRVNNTHPILLWIDSCFDAKHLWKMRIEGIAYFLADGSYRWSVFSSNSFAWAILLSNIYSEIVFPVSLLKTFDR